MQDQTQSVTLVPIFSRGWMQPFDWLQPTMYYAELRRLVSLLPVSSNCRRWLALRAAGRYLGGLCIVLFKYRSRTHDARSHMMRFSKI